MKSPVHGLALRSAWEGQYKVGDFLPILCNFPFGIS